MAFKEAHIDKNGKAQISIYDRDPRGPHDSIHIKFSNWGTDGPGTIRDPDGKIIDVNVKYNLK